MNEFCTSVAIMEKGRIVVHGRIDEVNARIMGDSLLSVDVLCDPGPFEAIVAADDRAGPIERKEQPELEFRYRGDAEAASELLATAGPPGHPGRGFSRRRDNLEELFLKVGSEGAFVMNWDGLRRVARESDLRQARAIAAPAGKRSCPRS